MEAVETQTRDPTALVLRDLLLEVAIQRVNATRELRSVVACTEPQDADRPGVQVGDTRLRRRAKARFIAAVGAAGASSALAKRS